MGKFLRFLENYCAALTKKYWILKKEQILNLTTFVFFDIILREHFFFLVNFSLQLSLYYVGYLR